MNSECDPVVEQEDLLEYKKGGYHPVEVGDLFLNRYLAKKKIGWGVFSTVWLCHDSETNTHVAMKIQKSANYYSNAANEEIDTLQVLSNLCKDPMWASPSNSQKKYVVQLLNSFSHRGPNGRHICMIFEILGLNLYEVIKIYNSKGLPLPLCKSFMTQILTGLDFLHRGAGIVHTDLKPENILLELAQVQINELVAFGEIKTQIKRKIQVVETVLKPMIRNLPIEKAKPIEKKKLPRKKAPTLKTTQSCFPLKTARTLNLKSVKPIGKKKGKTGQVSNEVYFDEKIGLKIADFGNAVSVTSLCNNEIQTRQYRAPEVILGNRYTTAADMWSVGCILFELITGELLYQPHIGEDFTEDDDHLAQIWESLGTFPIEWALASKKAWKYFFRNQLKKVAELHLFPIKEMLTTRYKIGHRQAQEISDFLVLMLEVEPEKRITAEACLRHPWLQPRNPLQ